MKLRPSDPDYNQFDQESERLGDTDLANRLTRLFRELEQGAVVIFNGAWGVGKTTFIRRWVAQLGREAIPAVYLDAFTIDFLESPFVAVAGSIAEAVERAHKQNDPKYERFLRSAAKVGRSLAASAAKIGVRAATLGAISAADLETLATVSDVASDALADYAEAGVKKLIEQHTARHQEVAGLRDSLAELPSLLAPDVSPPPPLVIVIDELDRCRPDFALGLLETLKHFFRAPNTHFVLVANRDQIENSITHRYGEKVNSTEYLRKFYDFQIDFTIDYSERNDSRIALFVSRLNSELLKNVPDNHYVETYIRDIARAYRLSLRDIENIYTNLLLAYAVIDNRYRPAILVSVLAVLKVISPPTYGKAKTGDLSFSELNAVAFANRDWGQFDVEHLRKVFRWHLDPNLNEKDPEWSRFGGEWRYHLGRLDVIKFIANTIMDRFEPPSSSPDGSLK